MLRTFPIFLLLLLCATPFAEAYHIAGAELTYRCLGKGSGGNYRYEVNLTMYRDCSNDNRPDVARWDDTIYVYIYESASRRLSEIVRVPQPPDTPRVKPAGPLACIAVPPSICLEVGAYRFIIEKPPLNGGYVIGWARCCRNSAITNLENPLDIGVTFTAHIPDPGLAECSSSPVFKDYPPLFLCNKVRLTFDHGALDEDGDSLVYRLTNPFTGLNLSGLGALNLPAYRRTVNPNNVLGPPPYENVTFKIGYDSLNPFGTNSFISLNERTGELIIEPSQQGLFVLAVSVLEYRNGKLLSETKRDMQLYVLPCRPLGTPPVITHNLKGLQTDRDTIVIEYKADFCYTAHVLDLDSVTSLKVSGASRAFSSGDVKITSVKGKNPVDVTICGKMGCEFINRTVPLILTAVDSNQCPVFYRVYDTVWVRVTPPPSFKPSIIINYADRAGPLQDTTVIQLDSSVCYTFKVRTDGDAAKLNYEVNFSPSLTNPPPDVQATQNAAGFDLKICWKGDCRGVRDKVFITVAGLYPNICSTTIRVADTVWIRVKEPFNPKAVLTKSLEGLNRVKDTLILEYKDSFCFPFQLRDKLPAGRLSISAKMVRRNGQPFSAAAPVLREVQNINDTLITGLACWQASCAHINEILELILIGKDDTRCVEQYKLYDTTYIKVIEPYNPPPTLTLQVSDKYNRRGDTLVIMADSSLCFDFVLADSTPVSRLAAVVRPERMNGEPYAENAPIVETKLLNDTTLTGTVCWKASCHYLNEIIRLVVEGQDYGPCVLNHVRRDTLYVRIIQRNLAPATLTHNFLNLPFDGDTVFFYVKQPGCLDLDFDDRLNDGVLSLAFEGPLATNAVTSQGRISPEQGQARLQSQFCWQAGCAELGRVFPVYVTGLSAPYCALPFMLQDTFFVKVVEPVNHPPTLTFDPIPAAHLIPGQEVCVTFTVTDPDTFSLLHTFGTSKTFLRTYGSGAFAKLTVEGENPIIGKVCFTPNCYLSRQSYFIQVCADDSTLCTEVLEDCDSVRLNIDDCGLQFVNVFTPNGDGVNDDFGPVLLEGVLNYEMQIFDRWGRLLFATKNMQRWNGTQDGDHVPPGVYFYVVHYYFQNGEGPVLDGVRTGSFTLLR